jgi:hypothetical protein
MHVIEPDPDQALLMALAGCCPSVDAPAAPVGNAANLLHIQMDQVSCGLPFVAQAGGLDRTDRDTGNGIKITNVRHVMAGQNR